jgi:hypothetical protein
MMAPLLGMLKTMVSAPALALASWMAALKVHWFADVIPHNPSPGLLSASSAVELTVKIAAWAGLAVSTSAINMPTDRARTKKARVLALFGHIGSGAAIPNMLHSLSLALQLGA